MEMEYINENTIRVFIDTDDLIERGISFMDIMSNQNEVEHFFMSILEEVDVSQKFQHTEAITFQVMPKRNGIDLYISKGFGDDNEEDSAFQQLMETIGELEDEDKAKSSERQSILDDQAKQDTNRKKIASAGTVEPRVPREITLAFRIFEDFLAFARDFKDQYAQVDLYLYNEVYFALVKFEANELSDSEIEDLAFLAQEYGEVSTLNAGLIRERGHEIARGNASVQVRRAFG
ncbi:adaptor protein MecA [Aerococcus urinaeequi]|uniref:Adapter protein MecA n=1 Tax=Aerococcus viridans TaxID=1377 RepID=A0A2N6UD16_9LACT|nr:MULTISPECIES: adaptor protein MecA [Aerococcus]OFU51233.1 adapter protein MecA [Aerococcus sp. HMSC10H05]PMC79462.1 adapter protein MecA [Aerococcus viridans]